MNERVLYFWCRYFLTKEAANGLTASF